MKADEMWRRDESPERRVSPDDDSSSRRSMPRKAAVVGAGLHSQPPLGESRYEWIAVLGRHHRLRRHGVRSVTVIGTMDDRIDRLHDSLERDFRLRTGQLGMLMIHRARLGHAGNHAEGLDQMIDAARQALAGTALALRRMAEGRYGTCEHCGSRIQLERLEAAPDARRCARCGADLPYAAASTGH
jgi:DNA-directed RNA polymerase subunit RPC12/RpoP